MDLLAQAQAGDGDAFGQLVEPYRRELQVHCYRFLGSVQDAEDALQDTLLSAWQGLAGFEGRASVRTWLYRVATSRCLDALRSARRRPPVSAPPAGLEPPEPTRLGEVPWLEPYPDVLLEGLADAAPGPEARFEVLESVSLAFITALQLLPPRQRAALILRDVLGFHASEAARILDTSEESVTSALKRARAALERQPRAKREPAPPPDSAAEQLLVQRLTRAFEAADVDGIVALLTEDAWLTMPPLPLEYQGRELAAQFLTATVFRPGWTARLVATRANGQPAFGFYAHDRGTGTFYTVGLMVLTLSGTRISAMTRFDSSTLTRFGLPAILTD
ncbi:MAG TPA: sigma-70 family RNA polymerase sigma factor [Streptosporangiaceae bacterium]|jgi:RNA polymerase sigma-70 factor (ECF subfamily)